MQLRTLALFSLEEIAKLRRPLADALQISGLELVYKNLTKTSTPFKLRIWYLHCSSKDKLDIIFKRSRTTCSSEVFKQIVI